MLSAPPPPGPTFLNTCSYATIHFQNTTTCLDQQINSITSSAKTIKHIITIYLQSIYVESMHTCAKHMSGLTFLLFHPSCIKSILGIQFHWHVHYLASTQTLLCCSISWSELALSLVYLNHTCIFQKLFIFQVTSVTSIKRSLRPWPPRMRQEMCILTIYALLWAKIRSLSWITIHSTRSRMVPSPFWTFQLSRWHPQTNQLWSASWMLYLTCQVQFPRQTSRNIWCLTVLVLTYHLHLDWRKT